MRISAPLVTIAHKALPQRLNVRLALTNTKIIKLNAYHVQRDTTAPLALKIQSFAQLVLIVSQIQQRMNLVLSASTCQTLVHLLSAWIAHLGTRAEQRDSALQPSFVMLVIGASLELIS